MAFTIVWKGSPLYTCCTVLYVHIPICIKFRAGGRTPDASAGTGQAGLCWRSPVRVGGLGGREVATQQQKRIYCYEMYFKHDLPHDVG